MLAAFWHVYIYIKTEQGQTVLQNKADLSVFCLYTIVIYKSVG